MMLLTALAACSLLAPVPGLKPQPTYSVVLGKCVSTDSASNPNLVSTVEVVEQPFGGKALIGRRVELEYMNADADFTSIHSSQLLIPPLRPGDRTYLIVSHTNGRNVAAIYDCDFAKEHLLPWLHHLTHPLREKDEGSPTWNFRNNPSEAKTKQLAAVVAAALGATDHKDWEALIRQHRDSPNEPLQDYITWLKARLPK